MPWSFLEAFFLTCLGWALSDFSVAHWLIPLAVLSRLGYVALLRAGEITSLVAGDLMVSNACDCLKTLVVATESQRYR